MRCKSSRSLRSKKEELESHSRRDILKIAIETQLQSYTDHYGVTWHGKKREFVNAPINSYDSLGSVGHIIIDEVRKVTTPWSKLYEKQYELQVYCRWHELRVSKPHSAELPREDSMMILDQLEREIKQMQRRLDRYHVIQKARKHLKGKANERAIHSINEITNLNSDKELSDFSNSSNDDFQNIYLHV